MVEFDQTAFKIDDMLNHAVRSIDPNILQHCKQYFEKNLFYLYGGKLELNIIPDAEPILSDAYSYVRNGTSFLLTLTQSNFLKLSAPLWLQDELNKKIPEFSKKMKIDETKFRDAVLLLKEKITFVNMANDTAHNAILSKIEQRDKKDAPYAKLYFSIKSQGILTNDKHLDIPEIRVWKRPGIIGEVITVFEKGALSFALIGETMPLIFRFLYELCIAVLKGIWEVIRMVGVSIASLIEGGITALSKLPNQIKALIGMGIILLMLWNKGREAITNVLQNLAQGFANILMWFYDAIKSVLSTISPLIDVGLTALDVLFMKVGETISVYEKINIPIAVSS